MPTIIGDATVWHADCMAILLSRAPAFVPGMHKHIFSKKGDSKWRCLAWCPNPIDSIQDSSKAISVSVKLSSSRSLWANKKSFKESDKKTDNDDDKLEKVWKQEHSLQDLVSDKEFKSYDDLKKRLDKVLGAADVPKSTVDKPIKKVTEDSPPWEPSLAEGEDDDMAYFSKLADDWWAYRKFIFPVLSLSIVCSLIVTRATSFGS